MEAYSLSSIGPSYEWQSERVMNVVTSRRLRESQRSLDRFDQPNVKDKEIIGVSKRKCVDTTRMELVTLARVGIRVNHFVFSTRSTMKAPPNL